jgi:Raf kinase inhibitor-like YbhB/YbcL family protein
LPGCGTRKLVYRPQGQSEEVNMSKHTHLVLFAAAICIGAAAAPALGAQGSGPPTVMSMVKPKNNAQLTVTSSAFKNDAMLPETYTQFGQNVSPPLQWSAGPAGTQSYVVMTEDTGVNRPMPIDHWVIFDIPANVHALPQGVQTDAHPNNVSGAMQGTNIAKKVGYIGPKPPAGQTHPYHFEVFALNTKLNLDPASTDRTKVGEAMKGHVLADGQIVGMVTGK